MKFLLALAILFSSIDARASDSWDDYKYYVNECNNPKQRGAKCIAEIGRLIDGNILWGEASANYNKGKEEFLNSGLQINFSADKGEEGDFQIERVEGEFIPKISLSKSADAYELLITINHELVHFANSGSLKKLYGDKKKINGCITPYRLELLRNEQSAYFSEIYFWKMSPEWFKNEQKRSHFDSRILGKEKILYKDYYVQLEAQLVRDPYYIARRYIEFKKYPKCALALLQKN